MGRGWRPEYSTVLGVDGLQSALPSWMTFTRGAGSWSRQTAAAVDGTTFIELGTAQNTPRFDYDPTSGRTMLLIEPTRTNVLGNPLFVDVAPANGTPDGWTVVAGVTAVDFETALAGPHNGTVFRFLDTAVANRGVYYEPSLLAAGTAYTYSLWTRRTGTAGAASLFCFATDPGNVTMTLDATLHDWLREFGSGSTVGGTVDRVYMTANGTPPGVVSMCLVQCEAGDCATSPIIGAASVTRAAELCAVDPGVIGANSGYVSFLWRPDYASTAALTVSPVLLEWAPNWELYFDPADDKLKLTVDSAAGAESAALTFARQGLLHVAVRYGSFGTRLYVDGVETTDASAWGTPTLAPYLGSRAASVNCRPSGYGNFLSCSV